MTQELITTIIVAVVGSTALATLIQFFVKRHDDQKGGLARIEAKLDAHIAEDERDKAVMSRRRIIRFSDEMYSGTKHSQEHFNSVIDDDINPYKQYCSDHPEFMNDRAKVAIERITDCYQKCLEEHSFL